MTIELKTVSNFISEDEKPGINDLLETYHNLSNKINDYKKIVEPIKEQLKEIGVVGVNQTSDWEFYIAYTPASTTLDQDLLKEKYPEIFAECQKPKKEVYTLKKVESRKGKMKLNETK